MNRRNFIKVTGIVSLLGLTNLSFAENELKWISVDNEMSEIGQKIVVKRSFTDSEYTNKTDQVLVGKIFPSKEKINGDYAFLVRVYRNDQSNTIKTNNRILNEKIVEFYQDYGHQRYQTKKMLTESERYINVYFLMRNMENMKVSWFPYQENMPNYL